nr:phosphoribosyl-AMP cyclohydrolase [Salsipaludibacter albus]
MVDQLAFDDRGLLPAVVQDHASGDVLMVAWMNAEAVTATLDEGRTVFWSRSRQQLWRKGETSGHVQHVVDLHVDCDADTLLVTVDQDGVACHTGAWTCFHRRPADLTAPDQDPA